MTPEPKRRLTATELAHLVGVSRQAIADAKRRGALAPDAQGLYDITSSTVERFISKLPHQRRAAQRKALHASERQDEKAPESAIASEPERPRARNTEQLGGESEESYTSAERRLKIAQANLADARYREKIGTLIPRDLVSVFLNRLWQIDSSEFVTRGDRMADMLAAISRSADDDGTASLEINRLLTEDAYAEQRRKKEMLHKYLKSIKSGLDDTPTEEGAENDPQ